MRNTTFCMLLAAALMMLGAITVSFMKSSEIDEKEDETLAVLAETEEAGWELPVEGTVCEAFGARYSAEYGQWTFRDYEAVGLEGEEAVRSPTSGMIEKIEGLDEGSCVTIVSEDAMIRIWPVKEVRVFEKSRVEPGTILGTAEEKLYIRIERDGNAVNPEDVFKGRNMN